MFPNCQRQGADHTVNEKGIYGVAVTSYSLILSLRVRIPARAVLYFWSIFFPGLYSIFPLYRLSEALLGLRFILQKCLESDSTGRVQVSLNSTGWTLRSYQSLTFYVGCRMLRVFHNGGGLGPLPPAALVWIGNVADHPERLVALNCSAQPRLLVHTCAYTNVFNTHCGIRHVYILS